MSSEEEAPPRRTREADNEAPAVRRRPHHHHRRGGRRLAAQLTREMATMAANMRSITNQNMAMQELLRQMQGQGGPPPPSFVPQGPYQPDEVQSRRAYSSRQYRRGSPVEREVGVDISSNYASGRPSEAPFNMEDNFPPEYEPAPRPQRSASVFDRLSPIGQRRRQRDAAHAPTNRPQPPPPEVRQPEERQERAPRAMPPRHERLRRDEEAHNQAGPSTQQPGMKLRLIMIRMVPKDPVT